MTGASAWLLTSLLVAVAATAPPEPEGYRNEAYHAAVPATLAGRAAMETAQAEALWRAGTAVFVDVLARPPRPAGLPPDTVWLPKPRLDIPGSIWLPDTGYGVLPPGAAHYLEQSLQEATGGDPARRLVFYCLAECWMSWNAAKRARTLGYTSVDWYAAGTEAWAAAGLPLEKREPFVPRAE